jgi:hypothetical protein
LGFFRRLSQPFALSLLIILLLLVVVLVEQAHFPTDLALVVVELAVTELLLAHLVEVQPLNQN